MSVSYEDNNNKEFTNSLPGRKEEGDCYNSPNQPVVDPYYHNNAAHAAMTKIIII